MRVFKIGLYMILGLMCLVLTGYYLYGMFEYVYELIVDRPDIFIGFKYGIWGLIMSCMMILTAMYTTVSMFKNAIKLIRRKK